MEELRETGKFKAWIKNPYNLALIAILLFALGMRLYYLNLASNQPLWWDESEYASAAQHYALGTPAWSSFSRTLLWPVLASPLYLLGIGEIGMKFLEIIFVVISIFVLWLITKKLYDGKTAILTAALSAVFWVTTFWSIRIGTDFPAFLLQLLTILFFFRYLDDNKSKNLSIAAAFVILAFLMRTQSFLLIATLGIFYLFVKGKTLLQNKKLVLLSIIALACFALFILTIGKSMLIKPNLDQPIYWGTFSFIGAYLNPLLLVIFFIGLIIFLIHIVLSLDIIKTNKESKSDFFLLLILILWFGFFTFYIRAAEDRWLLMTSLPIFIIVSKGLMLIYDFIKKYSKAIAVIAIVLLLAAGSYFEVQQADSIIKLKKDTYIQVKEAALWVKDNSVKGDIIFSVSAPQTNYYSGRETINYGGFSNETDFEDKIQEFKPKFLTVSVFETHPSWIYDWPQKNNETVQPVQAYYLDNEQKQLALVIYKFK